MCMPWPCVDRRLHVWVCRRCPDARRWERIFVMVSVMRLGVSATLLGACWFGGSAKADTILNFTADPGNPKLPEFSYSNGTGLSPGSGAGTENGLPNPPGLQLSSSFFPTIVDASLNFGPFANNGDVTGAGTLANPFVQVLSGGTFTIADLTTSNTLLTGTVSDAAISQVVIGKTGGVLSGTVTYTGGALFPLLALNGLGNPGSFSFTLSNLTATGTVGTHLKSFNADGTGQFTASAAVVPLPGAALGGMALLGGSGVFGLIRRRAAISA